MIMTRPGDLLFYPATPRGGLVSRLLGAIQLLMRHGTSATQYSHVSVAGPAGVQYEAWMPESRESLVNPLDVIEVWRPVRATEEQGLEAMRWASSHLGQRYDTGRFMFGLFRLRNSNICSTFAASAWMDSGYDLARNAGRWITPNDLISSGLLEMVSLRYSAAEAIKGE